MRGSGARPWGRCISIRSQVPIRRRARRPSRGFRWPGQSVLANRESWPTPDGLIATSADSWTELALGTLNEGANSLPSQPNNNSINECESVAFIDFVPIPEYASTSVRRYTASRYREMGVEALVGRQQTYDAEKGRGYQKKGRGRGRRRGYLASINGNARHPSGSLDGGVDRSGGGTGICGSARHTRIAAGLFLSARLCRRDHRQSHFWTSSTQVRRYPA